MTSKSTKKRKRTSSASKTPPVASVFLHSRRRSKRLKKTKTPEAEKLPSPVVGILKKPDKFYIYSYFKKKKETKRYFLQTNENFNINYAIKEDVIRLYAVNEFDEFMDEFKREYYDDTVLREDMQILTTIVKKNDTVVVEQLTPPYDPYDETQYNMIWKLNANNSPS
jgi:hypothetical protein